MTAALKKSNFFWEERDLKAEEAFSLLILKAYSNSARFWQDDPQLVYQ